MRPVIRATLFLALALALSAFSGATTATAQRASDPGAAREIVTLPNKPPQRSGNREPSAQSLIETWLAGYGWNKDKRGMPARSAISPRSPSRLSKS